MFIKYQHIERFGTDETMGIENGLCFVFPKVDGTNSSVFLNEEGELSAGSRNRELTLENDNAGFYAYIKEDANIKAFLIEHPTLRIFGEYLVPHSLKTYRDSAWRKFYVFDICKSSGEYMPYEEYVPLLEKHNIEYIPPLAIITNPTHEQLIKIMEQNTYLIKDGEGAGEGVVIKRYAYRNKYGRQTWAKIVRTEFKEKQGKVMGAPYMKGTTNVEDRIIDVFCTPALITKTFEKIKVDNNGWSSKYIHQLISRIWHDLITEECWNFIKKNKNPIINFKILYTKLVIKVKETLPELF